MTRRNTSVERASGEDRRLVPRVSIHETDEAVVVHAEMPGVSKEALEVSVDGDRLTIRGSKAGSAYNDGTFLQRETYDGVYEREFTLGEAVDRSKITARMEHGVLAVTLAKAEHAKPRKVEVAVD